MPELTIWGLSSTRVPPALCALREEELDALAALYARVEQGRERIQDSWTTRIVCKEMSGKFSLRQVA